jgi:hypothetical protein
MTMTKILFYSRKMVFNISIGYLILCYYGVIVLFLLPLPLGSRENMDHYLPFMLRNLPWAIITTLTGTIQLYSSFGAKYIIVMFTLGSALPFYLAIQFIKTIFDHNF